MCASDPNGHPRDVLRAHGLAANQKLGQNFLLSADVADRIVREARVGPQDAVLEIGTGLGQLTERLARAAAAVVTVEIDRGLCEIAKSRLAPYPNVILLHADFLESKHRINPLVTDAVRSAGGGRVSKVVSNLPYQICSPAVINLLEWELPVAEMDVMLQAEVVERLAAGPGTSEYGPLTVFVAYRAAVEVLFPLPPSAFWPQPAVSSQFVRIVPHAPQTEARSYDMFSQAVNKLFQSRRKTLSRALKIGWGDDVAGKVIRDVSLEPTRRPDTLTVAEFVSIADALAIAK
jgi:16S rRNA (adenine1518-N6/adenine1519-N6)-dimethyltransferase